MRILGLDYGSKTVGVAVTDPLRLTAQGVEIIRRKHPVKLRKTIARIKELIEEYDVEKIVLGLPLNLDGTAGERVDKTKAFAELLKAKTGLEIIFEDERLTTVEAQEILIDLGKSEEEWDEYIDMVAAVVILEQYMASHGEEDKEEKED